MKKKNSMQNVNFGSLDEFYNFIPEAESVIVNALRNIIQACMPHCTEKLSYNVPYFSLYNTVCFIWPPSVQWGNSKQKGVRLGFAKGYLLTDEYGYLDKGSRKQIYWKEITSVEQIDEEIIIGLLCEAIMLDEEHEAAKRMQRRHR
ncbi:MAG: DUF1801 domain-containing protein [Ignavibacteriales bacterium]|nr:DUF1801 domain-containing protein [Ignavibacteriales bacterium]